MALAVLSSSSVLAGKKDCIKAWKTWQHLHFKYHNYSDKHLVHAYTLYVYTYTDAYLDI